MIIEEAKKKLTALARSQIGYREGADNYTKYANDSRITRLYGWSVQNQPWCCTFVNWCAHFFQEALCFEISLSTTLTARSCWMSTHLRLMFRSAA